MTGEPGAGALRFGVMLRGDTVRAWQRRVLDELIEVPGLEPALLIVDGREGPSHGAAARLRRLAGSRGALWDLYNNGWVARRSRALAPAPLPPGFDSVPRLEVHPEQSGYSEYFPPDAVAAIASANLDFALRFAFGIIRGEILDACRFGIWSYHHDDEQRFRGGPPAFWEIVEGDSVTGAVLQRLTDSLDAGRILHRGWFRTVAHSYVQNTDAVHLGATDWPARVCRAILAGDEQAGCGVQTLSSAPLMRKPGNRTTAAFGARQAGRFLRRQWDGVLRGDDWGIGVIEAPVHRFLDASFDPDVSWLTLPGGQLHDPGAYHADPFPLPVPGRRTILFERFDRRSRRGEIWELPLEGGAPGPAGMPVGTHASYPFTFESGTRTFCVPQVAAEPPRLFELTARGWVRGPRIGPEHPLLDPTVFEWEGLWWLLGSLPGEHSQTKLAGWWAPSLEGPWTPHRLNPLKTDVRSARPAGTAFTHDGRLFRPAQDCSEAYGGAVALCEVGRLDPSSFAEEVVRVIRPHPSWPYPDGMHTLAGAGERTYIDARRSIFDRHRSLDELRARARALRRHQR